MVKKTKAAGILLACAVVLGCLSPYMMISASAEPAAETSESTTAASSEQATEAQGTDDEITLYEADWQTRYNAVRQFNVMEHEYLGAHGTAPDGTPIDRNGKLDLYNAAVAAQESEEEIESLYYDAVETRNAVFDLYDACIENWQLEEQMYNALSEEAKQEKEGSHMRIFTNYEPGLVMYEDILEKIPAAPFAEARSAYRAGWEDRRTSLRDFIADANYYAGTDYVNPNGDHVVIEGVLQKYNTSLSDGTNEAEVRTLYEDAVAARNKALASYEAFTSNWEEEMRLYNALPSSLKVEDSVDYEEDYCYFEEHRRMESNYTSGLERYENVWNEIPADLPSEDDSSDTAEDVNDETQTEPPFVMPADAENMAAVTTSSGDILESVVPTVNTSDTAVALTTSGDSLVGALNAAVPEEQVQPGQFVAVSVGELANEEAKQVISSAAASTGAAVSKYLDISLNKYEVSGTHAGKITQLSSNVEFVVETPKEINIYI